MLKLILTNLGILTVRKGTVTNNNIKTTFRIFLLLTSKDAKNFSHCVTEIW